METITKVNEILVSYNGVKNAETISSSKHVYEACMKAFLLPLNQICLKEYFYIIYLNRANKIIGFYKLSEGGLAGTVVDLRIAYSVALKCLASSIILCHNHPSGNCNPSESDINLTKKFKEAGVILEISVLDHIILTEDSCYSFADEGII